jgi:hypothetical protein
MHDYTAHWIAKAIYSKVDDEGDKYVLLDAIIDHKRDDGWNHHMGILSEFDGITPITSDRIGCFKGRQHWAQFSLLDTMSDEHQKDIINAVTARYLKHQHKFGIKIPSLLEEA